MHPNKSAEKFRRDKALPDFLSLATMRLKGSAFRSGMYKGYTSTYIVEFLVMFSNILVYRLCTHYFSSEGLADFSIYKRIFAFVQPILLMGLLIGVTRFVAQAFEPKERFQYYFTSFIFLGLLSILVAVLMNSFSGTISELFFGDQRLEKYILPLGLSITGGYLHLMTYGYLRGKHDFFEANLLQFVNMAVIPVVVFFWSYNLEQVLLNTAIFWSLTSLVHFIVLVIRHASYERTLFDRRKLYELLKFGIPRIPGDVAFGGLFALPVIFTSHFYDSEIAGRMAFSLSLLNIVGAAFSPLSLMLLPTISRKLTANEWFAANKQIRNSILITILLSSIGVVLYELMAHKILTLYLGAEIESWVYDTQIIMLGGVFYATFISMRSVIDAYHVKAVNSLNLVITVICFCALSLIAGGLKLDYMWFYIAFILSLILLFSLTLFTIRKILYKLKLNNGGE